MPYALTLALILSATPFLFNKLSKWWKKYLTRNMINDYDTLNMQILYGCFTWSEACQEITDFKYTWIDHPECMNYVGLLKRALEKTLPEKTLGI